MKIALHSVPGLDRWMGGVNYIKSIIYALHKVKQTDKRELELVLIMYSIKEKEIYEDIFPLLDNYYFQDQDFPPYTLSNRLKWFVQRKVFKNINPRLNSFLEKIDIDFFYSGIPYYHAQKKQFSFTYAKWLPDFQFKYFPEATNLSDRIGLEKEFQEASDHASVIVVSSETVKKDCATFLPDSLHKVFVYRFTVNIKSEQISNDPTVGLKKYHLPAQYFMVANLFAPTKNHINLFKAVAQLKQEGVEIQIVCSGNLYDYRNPYYANTIMQTIAELGIYNNIHILGSIPRQDQLQIFRCAAAIIQPSFFEGWNTSVEEAKMFGKKVLASHLPIHKEQLEETADFFDPDNVQHIADVLKRAWLSQTVFSLDAEQHAIEAYNVKILDSGRKFLELIDLANALKS